ncbi:xanthine dehydrogenase [Streptomyces venezuelae]|uniref:2Fe-2S iron-sulfur cluster-binding protein n=1 Tax=Streptomyces venezuelae TaxID=54571 RepID=UPI00123DE566|nr:(2Fe-2S)-binding protein [Streptomyces venezuelae]QES14906.1 xanthine dehydrogenase [Streptomyces venezuelae]
MSSNDQHGNQGGWEPIPQSEGYDGDATAFVQLPPDFMLDGVPLEAPGHGYVPPMITPLQPLTPEAATDPAATGTWSVHLPAQAEQTQYFDGAAGTEYGEHGGFGAGRYATGQAETAEHAEYAEYAERDPHATAEWRFTEVTADPAGPGATGQWEIPVVPDAADAAEGAGSAAESADFAASAVRPYADAPATLPGGAPAPWVLPQEPERPATEPAAEPEPATAVEHVEPVGAVEHVETIETAGTAGTAGTETADESAPADTSEVSGVTEVSAVSDTPDASDASDASHASHVFHASDVSDGSDVTPESGVFAEVPEAEPAPPASFAASTDSDEHPHTSYTLRVNGADRPVTGSWIGESLLYVLRERLGLAGAKDGCSQGECGACNVQVDGRLVASCLVPAATAAGSEVRTVEGLAVDGEPSDVQRAMAKCGTVQCGFCIPGMCMTVHDLLEGNHAPTELEARQALAGNLCRCSGYRGVLEAVRDVVAEREASAAATASDTPDEQPRVPHQIPHPHDGGMA